MDRRRQSGSGRRSRKHSPHFAHQRPRLAPGHVEVPPSLAMPKRVFVICHYCGYGPDGEPPIDGACPKCGGHSWERFAIAEHLVPQHMK